jgi:hypothetical protein
LNEPPGPGRHGLLGLPVLGIAAGHSPTFSGPSPLNKVGTASGDCASKYSMMALVLMQL